MKVLLSTVENYRKDNTPESTGRFADRPLHLTFTGPDAPEKAVNALIQKFGISKETPIKSIRALMQRYHIEKEDL